MDRKLTADSSTSLGEFEIRSQLFEYCVDAKESAAKVDELAQVFKALENLDCGHYRSRKRNDYVEMAQQLYKMYQLLSKAMKHVRQNRLHCKYKLEQMRLNMHMFALAALHDQQFLSFCMGSDNRLLRHLLCPAKSELFMEQRSQLKPLTKAQLRAFVYKLTDQVQRLENEHEKIVTLAHTLSSKIDFVVDNMIHLYRNARTFRSLFLYTDQPMQQLFEQLEIARLSNLPAIDRNCISRYLASLVVLSVLGLYIALGLLLVKQYNF